jgi:hypothetical protein
MVSCYASALTSYIVTGFATGTSLGYLLAPHWSFDLSTNSLAAPAIERYMVDNVNGKHLGFCYGIAGIVAGSAKHAQLCRVDSEALQPPLCGNAINCEPGTMNARVSMLVVRFTSAVAPCGKTKASSGGRGADAYSLG